MEFKRAWCRAKKKLILLARWHFDKKQTLQFAINCDKCKNEIDKVKKKLRKAGCHRVFKRKVIRRIECVCGGDENCELCKGKNMINIYTCPRNILVEPGLRRILPYFYDYASSNCQIWPAGSRLESPLILQKAFELLLNIYNSELIKNLPKSNSKENPVQ